MKTLKHLLVLFTLLFVISFGTTAQTTYQNWTALPDSPSHLEVSWSTCQCSPLIGDEIRLFVFNESGNARTADFTLTISDAGQTDVTYTVAGLSLVAGQSTLAGCGTTFPVELATLVPSGFDPNTLTISITYN